MQNDAIMSNVFFIMFWLFVRINSEFGDKGSKIVDKTSMHA